LHIIAGVNFILVGIGGALGSMSRYGIGIAFAGSSFPYATLLVNVVGCFAIGLALPSLERVPLLSPEMRLLLVAGFLGGFTTFSAFGYETSVLIRYNGSLAATNIAANVVLGLAAVFTGRFLGGG
jgi:fluoride exporter